jgi:hypothetical protein
MTRGKIDTFIGGGADLFALGRLRQARDLEEGVRDFELGLREPVPADLLDAVEKLGDMIVGIVDVRSRPGR